MNCFMIKDKHHTYLQDIKERRPNSGSTWTDMYEVLNFIEEEYPVPPNPDNDLGITSSTEFYVGTGITF